MNEKAILMDATAMSRATTRIAHEIVEKNKGTENLCVIGIHRRGTVLAEMIAERINLFENVNIDTGVLDITFYRDDLTEVSEQPVLHNTQIDFSVEGKIVVIVDDVLYTGRTVRAAIEAIMDLGRPQKIQLAVLIDRGHRELPIRADFIGKNVPTSKTESIAVRVDRYDGCSQVVICDER